MAAVLGKEFLEVVAQGVGVAQGVALGSGEHDGGHVLVAVAHALTDIISSRPVVAVVVIVIRIPSELSLELEVLEDFPREAAIDVPRFAALQTVVVAHGLHRVVEVEVRVSRICCSISQSLDGERGVEDSILQTGVGAGVFVLLIHTTTGHLALGITHREIELRVLGRLHVELQAEVIAHEVGHLHDGFVVHVRIVERELHLV